MKKVANIVLLAVLAAGLLSCTKTDRFYGNPQEEIAMNPVMHSMSKAEVPGPVTGSQYPDAEHFGVIAYYSPSFTHSQEWTNTSSVLMYLDGHEFEKEGSTFSGIPKCYWPHQGSLVFAGYSPFDAIKESITFNPATKALTITGFVSNGQTDLMYFLPDLSNGNLVGRNSRASSVPAVFSHALSLVSFDMQVRDGDEDDIKLKKIILKDMYATGNFTVLASDPATAAWTRTSDARDTTVFNSDAGQGLSPSVQVDVLVIPGEAVDIQIVYETKFYDMDESAVVIKELTAEIDPSEVGVTTWETGKKYLYDVVKEANKIEVIPSTDYIGVIEKESQK